MKLKFYRQQHPYLYGFLAPARRFEEPFFHRFSGGKIKLTKAGGFLDENFTHAPAFQHPDSQYRNALRADFSRRFGIARLDLIAAERPGRCGESIAIAAAAEAVALIASA